MKMFSCSTDPGYKVNVSFAELPDGKKIFIILFSVSKELNLIEFSFHYSLHNNKLRLANGFLVC